MADLDILAPWLAAHDLALAPATRLTPLGGGLANRNERLELLSGPAVLRRPPPGLLAAGASDMGREARVLAALAPVFPLAPRLLGFEPDPAVLGTPFLIIEHRPGVAIRDVMPAGASVRRLAEITISQMQALHALDPASLGLADLGRPQGFWARQLAGWARRAAAVWPDGLPGVAHALITALNDAPPPPDPARPVLLHMDLKPDNLLLLPDLAPAAMIDWDMATTGPAAFDLAVLLSYWIEPSDPSALQALAAVPSLAAGAPSRAELAALYPQEVPLGWPLALARLRLAVAWVQLHRKWQRGELAGTRYKGFERLALAILDHAHQQFRSHAL